MITRNAVHSLIYTLDYKNLYIHVSGITLDYNNPVYTKCNHHVCMYRRDALVADRSGRCRVHEVRGALVVETEEEG